MDVIWLQPAVAAMTHAGTMGGLLLLLPPPNTP
jgi:hypothetical protein